MTEKDKRGPTKQARPGLAKALSERFGTPISPQQVAAWRKQGLPVDDPAALERHLMAEPRSPVGEDESLKEQLLREQVKKTRAERKLKELQHEIEQGKWRLASDMQRDCTALASLFEGGWLQLPRDMAPALEGMEALEIEKKLERYAVKQRAGIRKELVKLAEKG